MRTLATFAVSKLGSKLLYMHGSKSYFACSALDAQVSPKEIAAFSRLYKRFTIFTVDVFE